MQKNEPNNDFTSEYFRTSDLPLITVLSIQFPIVLVDRSNPKRIEFCFKNSQKLQLILQNYLESKLLIEPKTFFYQIKEIRAQIHEKE
jgi:hypothetical protein